MWCGYLGVCEGRCHGNGVSMVDLTMATDLGTVEAPHLPDTQLGPKGTKIREQLRNNVDE